MSTLLTLVSKQVWPQILAVAHLKPESVVLLHSHETSESKSPAQRLKRLFDEFGLVPKGASRLVEIPDDNFAEIENSFDAMQTKHGIELGQCLLNFTGGNKLMATAAFRWAAKRGVRSLYLERGNRLTRFEPREGEIVTTVEPLDGHLTDALDPLALIRCQMDDSEVERDGQRLTLAPAGRSVPDADFWKRLPSLDENQCYRWLRIEGQGNREKNHGDTLELITALALLRLGATQVRRSLRLKVKTGKSVSSRLPHAEIDLLFNYGGKLWLVDCKDRKPVTDLANGLRRISAPRTGADRQQFDELTNRIRDQLSISDTKVIKEDLLAAREIGGLLGETICVRRSALSDEVREFARRNRVHLIENCRQPHALRNGLEAILHPQAPAPADSLAGLKEHFRK